MLLTQVEFSPFNDHAMAVVGSQYFGIVGNGSLALLHLDERGVAEVRL